MNINSPHFSDGRIDETQITSDYVTLKIACAAVESGELVMMISPQPNGRIHFHFSGLAEKFLSLPVSEKSANEFVVEVVKK
jgi:hypothetical protein